jgi:hypothetical protein
MCDKFPRTSPMSTKDHLCRTQMSYLCIVIERKEAADPQQPAQPKCAIRQAQMTNEAQLIPPTLNNQ